MSREEVFERIANQVGKHDCSCSCEECRKMCQRTPCLGTPQDILALIDAGYVDKLSYVGWAAGMLLDHIPAPIPMIQIDVNKDGSCVFYHNGKCELHDNGLKPTEGKLSHHDISIIELKKEYNISYQVAIEWIKDENYEVVKEIVGKFYEASINIEDLEE